MKKIYKMCSMLVLLISMLHGHPTNNVSHMMHHIQDTIKNNPRLQMVGSISYPLFSLLLRPDLKIAYVTLTSIGLSATAAVAIPDNKVATFKKDSDNVFNKTGLFQAVGFATAYSLRQAKQTNIPLSHLFKVPMRIGALCGVASLCIDYGMQIMHDKFKTSKKI